MANVLIVDDSRTSRKLLRKLLEDSNHTVVGEAVDGQDGVIKYRELKPDIVTMDITMPVMDGIEALKLIKQENPSAKVVMVTAAGQQSKMIESIKLGAVDFLTKPFDASAIINLINNLK